MKIYFSLSQISDILLIEEWADIFIKSKLCKNF